MTALVTAGLLLVGAVVGGSGQADAASLPPTTTVLSADPTAAAYDSPITFTATVSASGKKPTGTVSFVDTTSGTLFAVVTLSGGRAAETTASLAPGTRSIVAQYSGSTTAAPSASAPVKVRIGASTDATAYQLDPAHDGAQPGTDLKTASLARRWSVTPGTGGTNSTYSYPLIADGKVFVVGGSPASIWALNAATGATVWFATASCEVGLAYDGHQLFCVSFGGTLTDYDADTGSIRWSHQLPGQYAFSAAPSAWDGVVYVSGAGEGGTVYAVTESDGVVRWTQGVENGDESSPAVDNAGVFVAYACQQDYGFSHQGLLKWHYAGECDGGGGDTVSLYGGSVYAIGETVGEPLILTQHTGATTGTFTSDTIPAFGSGSMYLVDSGSLVAADPSGSPDHWVQGTNVLSTPVTDQGDVFVVEGSVLVGYNAAGTKIWSGTVGAGSSADSVAVGDGLLVASAGHKITAFG